MRTLFAALLVATVLCGCTKKAESVSYVNKEFEVEKLFEHDGCKVYRFYDGGWQRYYTNCSGSTQWTQSCGKSCTSQEGVTGT
jgi:hypothetical protein